MIADTKTEDALYFVNAMLRALHNALPADTQERNITVRTPKGTTHISIDAGLLKAIADTGIIHKQLSLFQ